MLYLGLGSILFVPVFKTVTHLPPYVGMMLSLAVVATFAEIYSKAKFSISTVAGDEIDEHSSGAHHSPVHASLSKIEMPSIFGFIVYFLLVYLINIAVYHVWRLIYRTCCLCVSRKLIFRVYSLEYRGVN